MIFPAIHLRLQGIFQLAADDWNLAFAGVPGLGQHVRVQSGTTPVGPKHSGHSGQVGGYLAKRSCISDYRVHLWSH